MSTIIYPSPIFGPIHSRRLGISLGVNLMPSDGKVCTFDCLYCECGFNKDRRPSRPRPTRREVFASLKAQLQRMLDENKSLDVITFAGNGEPTAHPEFYEIVQDTIDLRNHYFPKAKVSVLSNATLIDRPKVFEVLKMVDNNILKLDTVDIDYIKTVNRPLLHYSLEQIINNMKRFNGHVIIQTMFMKAYINGFLVDNTMEKYVGPWLEAIRQIHPQQVMVYTIDRETPDKSLEKSTAAELNDIVRRVEDLGIKATASY